MFIYFEAFTESRRALHYLSKVPAIALFVTSQYIHGSSMTKSGVARGAPNITSKP